jgi:hypothetical protein
LTSAHVVGGLSADQISLSWSTVSDSAQSLSLLTTTVSASVATLISWGSTPLFWQFSISLSLIGRDALLRWESPGQKKFSNPPPEPVDWMSMLTSE